MNPPTVVATNLGGVIETPVLDGTPYRVDAAGRPYVPTGDGGVVLGVRLGDGVFDAWADHAAPGACVVHADQAARHALTSFACLGNAVVVRSGDAAGAHGVVLGKRGELGRVIACFPPDDLARLGPGDQVAVRGHGQGAQLPEPLAARGAVLMNVSPHALPLLPIHISGPTAHVSVRAAVPSYVVGNGIGRPMHQWDLDLQVDVGTAPTVGLGGLRLGDLVAVTDLDVRHNAGYRRGWATVGVVVHGGSPQPGHGPGVMPILTGPLTALDFTVDADAHHGVDETGLLNHDDRTAS